MNNRISRVYVAIDDNRVIYISTALSEFVRAMKALITGVKSYSHYQEVFQNQDVIQHVDKIGKKYYFQRIENS